ncbi:MAG: cyanophycin synthetase [Burkholderiales bacterium]|nr:cyanophycin synthetase [Burkholderiales bacterium]
MVASPAPVQLASRWRVLKGCAFGMPQRTVSGLLLVADTTPGELDALESGLRGLFDEKQAPGAASMPPQLRLVRELAFVVGAAQRHCKVAVSEAFHIAALRPGPQPGRRFEVALPGPHPKAAAATLDWVIEILRAMAEGGFDEAQARRRKDALARALQPFAETGANRYNLVRSAQLQGIPLLRWDANTMVFGTGSLARWVQSSATDRTPFLAVVMARRKHETAFMLREAGLPGGVNKLVASPAEAVAAARELGLPVVVKPANRDRGEGVTADLRDEDSVAAAFDEARQWSELVLVEKWFRGFTHRVNVNFGKVTRIARKIAGVIGDGVNDVTELVRLKQLTPDYRSFVRTYGRELLLIDDEARLLLGDLGRDASWVPPAGEYVRLRRRDNSATGATNQELDITDASQVHPDNLRLAEDAARVLRLDIAGIDLIMQDMSKSWLETGALICEINAQPQIPTLALMQALVYDIMGGGNGRIPAELFVCPAGEAARAQAHELAHSGSFGGVSEVEGLRVGGQRVSATFADGFAAGEALLLRKDVPRAACVMSPAHIVEHGLPLDRWDSVHYADEAAFTPAEQQLLPTVRRYVAAPAP